MKFFSKITVSLVLIVGISSCIKKETYPNTPHLTFNSLNVTTNDSLFIKVNFTDGDGDIGYSTTDFNPPLNCYIQLQRDSNNIFVPLLIITSSPPLNPVIGDTLCFPYNIPNITPSGSSKALKGTIKIALAKNIWDFAPISGQQVKFIIWIIDRAGNVSNRVMTTTVVMP